MFIGPCIIAIVEEWKTNLMSLVILFQLLCAQHVSDINISIFRSLLLCWWITTSVVLFSVRLCVGDLVWLVFWVVFVLQVEALVLQPATRTPPKTSRSKNSNTRRLSVPAFAYFLSGNLDFCFRFFDILQVSCNWKPKYHHPITLFIHNVRFLWQSYWNYAANFFKLKMNELFYVKLSDIADKRKLVHYASCCTKVYRSSSDKHFIRNNAFRLSYFI